MWEPFHVGFGPQPLHLDIICSRAVTQEISQLPKFRAYKYGYSCVMVGPSALPQHMNGLKHLFICMEWMWEPLHVGQGTQPLHLDIICSLTVTQEISQLPKFWADKYGGSGMMVDPSAHPQHIMVSNTLYMYGVDVGTIPGGSGASTIAP
jgi:hypothetical protein